MKILINKDYLYLFEKLDKNEKEEIIFDLENYILNQLYDKLFPSQNSEEDSLIYQKCEKLSCLKPKQIIEDKKIINENLLKESSKYFEQINLGNTPKEKLDYIIKGIKILKNLITLATGKELISSDDIFDPFFYSMIISKIKNLPSNSQYINMFLNRNLGNGLYDRISVDLASSLVFIDQLKIYN